MEEMSDYLAKLQSIMEKNPRYKLEAYNFIMAALNDTVSRLEKPRHVSGRELCEGIRRFALDQYGPLTRMVFEYWGLARTRDFGEIVFSLIEAGLMTRTEEDSVSDFDEIYDFRSAFTGLPEINLEDLDLEWGADKKETGGDE
jgi:uncharacterized repeat protein (TIGR04138 family)